MNRRSDGGSGYQPRAVSSTSTYVIGGVGALIVVAIVLAAMFWNGEGETQPVDEQVLADNAVAVVGYGGPVIDVFEDFACPHCRDFEEQSGPAMAAATETGELTVRYHLLTFMDDQSDSGDYSSRAAGAARCIAEQSPELFVAFQSVVYEQTPSDAQPDFTDEELARFAGDQGASTQTTECIITGAQVDAARSAGDASRQQLANARGGQAGTPTVLQGNTVVDGILDGPGWLDSVTA